jgi:hypothetical protein
MITPPRPGEGHDDFISRCQRDGGGKAECENLWTDAQGISDPPLPGGKGISLRPDFHAMREAERRSFVRACAATVLAVKDRTRPDAVLARTWPGDAMARRVLKAAQSPTTSSDLAMMTATVLLPMLAPQSASARLLGLSTQLDMTGVVTISLPYIGKTGVPVVPFVGEGLPAQMVDLTVSPTTLGPTKKLLIGSALTREVQDGSGDKAAAIIGSALSISAEQSMDALLFSNTAATAAAPAGLLSGITAIPGTTGGGVASIVADMAALAEAIATAGISSSGMTIITRPGLAEKTALVPGGFNHTLLVSAAVPAGDVIAVAAGGLVTGYDGSVKIEITDQPAIYAEDTTPTDISTAGSPPVVAFPTKSLWQADMLALKIRAEVAWVVHPGSVAWITGAAW